MMLEVGYWMLDVGHCEDEGRSRILDVGHCEDEGRSRILDIVTARAEPEAGCWMRNTVL